MKHKLDRRNTKEFLSELSGVISEPPIESPKTQPKFKTKQDLHDFLNKGTFALLSPYSKFRSPDENKIALKRMVKELSGSGLEFTPVMGKWNGQEEPSFMVHGISNDDATLLSRKYGQEAHIYADKGNNSDISHSQNYQSLGRGYGHIASDDLQDNHSIVHTGEGPVKFQLKLGT